jgi:hypothetical protein
VKQISSVITKMNEGEKEQNSKQDRYWQCRRNQSQTPFSSVELTDGNNTSPDAQDRPRK